MTRPSARHSVVIDRPVHEVFAYVVDGTTAPTGRASVKDIKLLAFQVVPGPARPRGRYDFEPASCGTRATFSLDWEPKGIKEKRVLEARRPPA